MRINGAQAIIECLKKENVNLVFGYPGGAVLTLYDALYQNKFPHILTKHEQGAILLLTVMLVLVEKLEYVLLHLVQVLPI